MKTTTICLYEYPAAKRDLKGWLNYMVELGKIVKVNWLDEERPIFTVQHNEAFEDVECFPLTDLLNKKIIKGNKIVIYGAIKPEIVQPLIEYLNEIVIIQTWAPFK